MVPSKQWKTQLHNFFKTFNFSQVLLYAGYLSDLNCMQCRLMLDFSLSKQEAEGSNVQLVQKLRDLCTAILKVSSHSTMILFFAIYKQSLMLMSVVSTADFTLGSFQCPCGRYQV